MGADEPPSELEHAQAARVIGDLVGDGDDLVADSQDRRHAVPRAIAAFVVTLAAAAAVVPGVVAESQANSGQIGREAGSLSGMNTPATVALPLVVCASVASGAQGAPPGWVKVADSVADFSDFQGQHGWWYLFDQGEGTPTQQMPYFVDSGALRIWCPAPRPAIDTFCQIHAGWSHANAPGACNSAGAGLQRPVRRWINERPEHLLIHVQIEAATTTSGLRTYLVADETAIAQWTWTYGNALPVDEYVEVPRASHISIVDDPLNDGCHGDGHIISIQIYSPDCDSNGIADAVDIAANPGIDTNHDGIPDTCQCRADLFADGRVDGADLGALLSYWGPVTSSAASRLCDISGDGRVDGSDLGILLANWGPCGQ